MAPRAIGSYLSARPSASQLRIFDLVPFRSIPIQIGLFLATILPKIPISTDTMAKPFLRLVCALVLPTALAQITVRDAPESLAEATTVDALDFSDAAEVQSATFRGVNVGCKCYPGESCWPSKTKWDNFNRTVDGRLRVHIPPGAACHNTFDGPLGTVNTYDAAKCAEATDNWANEQWT